MGEIDHEEESGTDSEEEDPNGGAAACVAAMDGDCWWERVIKEAGVSWEGSAQEFVDSEEIVEEAGRHWSEGADRLRQRLEELQCGSECKDLVVRAAAVMQDEFDCVHFCGRGARFARFVQAALGAECEEHCSAEYELESLYARHIRLL